MKRRIATSALLMVTASLLAGACGGGESGDGNGSGDGDASGDGDGLGDGDASGDGDGSGDGDASGDGDSSGLSTSDGTQLVGVPQIPGGGVNATPLEPGCGPETVHDCTPPGGGCDNRELLERGEVEVEKVGAVCFFGEGMEEPSATVEYITESVENDEYVHLRVIFDPDFVDTTFGECSLETGWKKMHTYKALNGSDHVELKLYDCADDLSMHMKVDFIDDKTADGACGLGTAGVTGGDGEMFVGDAAHVLAVGTSLDRNMNGCGYCDKEESPCPGGEFYEPSPNAPEWDFRMVYELWIDVEAFGDAGFCRPDIEYVHASPAKAEADTVTVESDDCPTPPDGDCPTDYELFLSSEGEFLCAGPPHDGDCPEGFEIDLTSEGELCIPAGEQ